MNDTNNTLEAGSEPSEPLRYGLSSVNGRAFRVDAQPNGSQLATFLPVLRPAATLLIAAGSNHDRLHSEAAFASLCGVNPIPASSGKTNRHRLNRGGHRQANAALHRIVVVRLRHDERTQAYMRRRTTEGMSKAEVIRCLKRYVAREVFSVLRNSALSHSTP